MWLTLRLDPAHRGRRRKGLSVVVLKIEFDFDQLRNKYSPYMVDWNQESVSYRKRRSGSWIVTRSVCGGER